MEERTSILTTNNFKTGLTTGVQAYKTIAEWNAPDVNYDLFKIQAGFKENQAKSIELDAQEHANYLRGQFSEAVGSYKTGMAQRNIKVGEGSGQMNIEDSAEELGYDIAKMKGNASHKAGLLRSQAAQYRAGAKTQKELTKYEKIGNLFDNIGTMAGLFGKFEAVKTTRDLEDKPPGGEETKQPGKEVEKKDELKRGDVSASFDVDSPSVAFNLPDEEVPRANIKKDELVFSDNEKYDKVKISKMAKNKKKDLLTKSIKQKLFVSSGSINDQELLKFFTDVGLTEKEIDEVLRSV
jgi:hypothetical protein